MRETHQKAGDILWVPPTGAHTVMTIGETARFVVIEVTK